MFYALATQKLATPGYKYTHVLADIRPERRCAEGNHDVTAVSFAASHLRDKYILLDWGASFGEGYGPIVVACKPLHQQELTGKRVSVPGLTTTAYLTLKLFQSHFARMLCPSIRFSTPYKPTSSMPAC